MMDDSEIGNLEEEDVDEANDETFGDMDGGEYNWENSQAYNKLFEKVHKNGKEVDDWEEDWEDEIYPEVPTAEQLQKYRDEYELDHEMEASISRLVEDDDEEYDPRPKPSRSLNSTSVTYLTPPQVQNRSIWPGADDNSSLLGSTVWGMPSTSTAADSIVGASNNTAKPRHVVNLLPAFESQQCAPRKTTSGGTGGNLKHLTLNEVEQEFFNSAENSNANVSGKSKAIKLEDLEREMMKTSVSPSRSTSQTQNGQLPMDVNLMPTSSLMSLRKSIEQQEAEIKILQAKAMRMDIMCNIKRFPRPQQPMSFHQHLGLPILSPPKMHSRFIVPPFNNYSCPLFHSHMPNPLDKARVDSARPRKISFMNEKDKQRLRNIQIIQLQNDHPHRTDYYFQMFKLRNNPRNEVIKQSALRKLFPTTNEALTKNDYKPAHFENSLGKIQAVSALAPKKVFDTVETDERVSYPSTGRQTQFANSRRTLFLIEKCYKHLQLVEEILIRREVLHQTEDDKCALALNLEELERICHSQIKQLVQFRKGRLLLLRVIPRLEFRARFRLIEQLLDSIEFWSRRGEAIGIESIKEDLVTLKVMQNVILAKENRDNSLYIPALQEVPTMIISKIGLSIINMVIHLIEFRPVGDSYENIERAVRCLTKIAGEIPDWSLLPYTITPKFFEFWKRTYCDGDMLREGPTSYARMVSKLTQKVAHIEDIKTIGLLDFDKVDKEDFKTVWILQD